MRSKTTVVLLILGLLAMVVPNLLATPGGNETTTASSPAPVRGIHWAEETNNGFCWGETGKCITNDY